jgi:UDP-N-acetylmuramoyl-tripeptide--D-alanyl-D-alanine ligase
MAAHDQSAAVRFSSEAFAEWTGGVPCNMPREFFGVTQSTRSLNPGMLYVALRGERFDGHEFVGPALKLGAAAALIERDCVLPRELRNAPVIRVDNTRRALLAAAAVWRRRCRAKIVGITGSSGKTTTKEMASALFRAGGRVCSTKGNFNNEIGLPLSLLAMSGDDDFGVFEVGTNHPGEIKQLADVLRPDCAIITCVGTAHIANFGSIEAIAQEKGALASAITPGGCLLLCTENAYFEPLKRNCDFPVFTVSLRNTDADYYGEMLDGMQGRIRVVERGSRNCTELESGLPGEHNAVNLLLAFAAAHIAGIPPRAAAEALRGNLAVPEMRWQLIERDQGIRIVNDAYNANAESVAAALSVFGQMRCDGRRIAVLGDMLELDSFAPELHRIVGAAAAEAQPDWLLLVGASSVRHTRDGAVGRGFPEDRIRCFNDVETAALGLKAEIGRGDLILLKASREMHLEYILKGL